MNLKILSILGLITVLGCGGGSDGGTGSSSAASSPLASPTSTATFKLINSTGTSIAGAYITLSTSPTWGPNLLATAVPNGGTHDFTGFAPGTYDAKATIVGTFSIYNGYLAGVTVAAGSTYTVTSVASAYSGSLKITNTSTTRTITGIYISPSSSSTWGPNQISSNIAPAGSFHFYDIYPDTYDYRIVWNTGVDSIYTGGVIQSLVYSTQNVN